MSISSDICRIDYFFLLPLIFICVFYRNCHFMSFSHFFLLIFLHVLSDFMGSLHDEFVICWLYSLLISCTIFLSHSYSCDFLQSFWITIQSKYITSEGNEFRTLFFKLNWFVFHILQNLLSEFIQLRIVTRLHNLYTNSEQFQHIKINRVLPSTLSPSQPVMGFINWFLQIQHVKNS